MDHLQIDNKNYIQNVLDQLNNDKIDIKYTNEAPAMHSRKQNNKKLV